MKAGATRAMPGGKAAATTGTTAPSVSLQPWHDLRRVVSDLSPETVVASVVVAGIGATRGAIVRALLSGVALMSPATAVRPPVPLAAVMAYRGMGDIIAGVGTEASRALAMASLVVSETCSVERDDAVESINAALPGLVASEAPVLVWCGGALSAAADSIRHDFTNLFVARELTASLVAARSMSDDAKHGTARSWMPRADGMPVGDQLADGGAVAGLRVPLRNVVLAVEDDLGWGTPAVAALTQTVQATLSLVLSDEELARVRLRVILVPVDAHGADAAVSRVADAALELASDALLSALAPAPRPPSHTTAITIDNDDMEVQLSEMEPITAAVARQDSLAIAPPPLVTARCMLRRLAVVPHPEKLFPFPTAIASVADLDDVATAVTEELQQEFMVEDAVVALKAHLRRQADASIAHAAGEFGDVAETRRHEWVRELDAEANAIAAAVGDTFFAKDPSDVARTRTYETYAQHSAAVLRAHRDFVVLAVLDDQRRALATKLGEKLAEAMDCMMSVRDARGQ
jgi:hypothetical protein